MTLEPVPAWASTTLTREQQIALVEAKAMEEYNQHLGKIVLVTAVSGFLLDESVCVLMDPPVKVRVEPTSEQTIKCWNKDWCDPLWNVSLVEPHPQFERFRSLWVAGVSHHVGGVGQQAGDVVSDSHERTKP